MLDILAGNPDAERVLERAGRVLGTPIADCLAGPPESLFANALAQPLICAAELATWAALRTGMPAPRVFAGYSVGEVAAHGCAGALDVESVVALARDRALAMDAACSEPCRMSAVRDLPVASVETLARLHGVEVAIVNFEDRVVVAGRAAAVDGFEAAARGRGAKTTPLPVSVASHTSLMRPAAETVRRWLEESDLKAPETQVLAGVDGGPVFSRSRAVETLAIQTAQTIRWDKCLEGLKEAGCTVLLELGPGSDLSRMARDASPRVAARSVSEFRSLDGVRTWVTRELDE